MSRTQDSPEGHVDAGRTDMTDPDEYRQELIRLAEDLDAGALDTAEQRTCGLLSDIRRTIAQQGGDGQ